MTAQTGTPRARRETSGTNSNGSPAASLIRYSPCMPMAARSAALSRTMAMPQS